MPNDLPRPDPRGPFTQVVKAVKTEKGNFYTLACGHVSEGSNHFHLDKVGSERRCFACGRKKLTEWEI